MPESPPHLDAYFARIGYQGPRDPSMATLRSIHFHHAVSIPFENLDVLLGRGIHLDLAAIEQKIVAHRRGGYCFEQNALFAAVLRALGFVVTPLSARVRWQVQEDMITPLTHMLLLVKCAGVRHIVDVGFGSMSLTAPLVLDTEAEQATPNEPRRLVRRPSSPDWPGEACDLYMHQAQRDGAWSDVYQFTLMPQAPIDYEVANWYTSTHPQSRFVQNLVAARVAGRLRYTLLNREFTVRHPDGHAEKRVLETPEELLEVLSQYFGLEFPEGTRFGRPGAPWPT